MRQKINATVDPVLDMTADEKSDALWAEFDALELALV